MVRYKFVHFNKRSDFDSNVPNPESNSANGNEFYNYVVFIKDSKEIYTHGQFYDCSKFDDTEILQLIQNLSDRFDTFESNLNDLTSEVEDNELVTAKALTDLNNKVESLERSWDDSIFELYVTKEDYNSNYSVIESRLNTVEGKTSLSQFTDDLIRGYKVINHGTGDTSYAITPNVYHIWDEVTSLSLIYDTPIDGFANEYLFQFTSGSTATTLSLPDTVKWANDNVISIESGKTYSISIVDNLALFASFAN